MWSAFERRAKEIADQTPDDRIRYADLLRVVAILAVVFGHWLLAHISVENGSIEAERVIALVPETQWLTWLFQVMPVFFFVGGMANAIGWDSALERGDGFVNWLRRRARRLLWPVVPFFVFWVPMVLLLDGLGMSSEMVALASQAVLIPLWFLAAYLCVVTISPLAYWLHRKIGIGAIVVFVLMAIAVDVLHRMGVPYVGWSNFVWVWGAIHQAGFFWYDQKMPKQAWISALVAVGGFGVLFLLTQLDGYPVSVVGTGQEGPSNNSPPSVALLALAVGQIGLIFALRSPLERWLEKTKVWGAVVMCGSRLMTVYIWHLTALVVVGAAVVPTGILPETNPVDLFWWLTRIPLVGLSTLVLLVLVAVFGRFERPRTGRATSLEGWPARIKAMIGVAMTTAGLAVLVAGGLSEGGGAAGVAWAPLGGLFVGRVLLGVIGSSFLGPDKE